MGRVYYEFVKSAKKSVNPELLQKEVAVLLLKHKDGHFVPLEELPTEVKNLSSVRIDYAAIDQWDPHPEHALMIAWGGGFGLFGLIVGSPTFPLPHGGTFSEVTEWIPGVAFFRSE